MAETKPSREEIKKLKQIDSMGVTFEVHETLQVPSLDEMEELLEAVGEKTVGIKIQKKSREVTNKFKLTNIVGKFRQKCEARKSKRKPRRLRILIVPKLKNLIAEKVILPMVQTSKKFKFILAVILLIGFILLTSIRGAMAMNSFDQLMTDANTHLNQSFDSIDNGNFSDALKYADLARLDIGKIKYLAQSWGQDVEYLRLVPGTKSPFVAEERLLNSAYTILNTLTVLSDQLIQAKQTGELEFKSIEGGIPTLNLAKSRTVILNIINDCRADLARSRDELKLASPNLPSAFKPQSEKALQTLDKSISSIDKTRQLLDNSFSWVGSGEKKLLILFQNNTEIRGTGGFIGSFAVAKINEGELDSIDFETNIYKMDKAFAAQTRIAPPAELDLLANSSWTMRDSNWAVDGPESFRKVMEFYNLESGKRVDGVVAMDTTLFIDLLKAVGPIELPEFSMTVSHENFLKDVQYEVEKGYFKRPGSTDENEPKKILSVLMPKFMQRLSEAFSDKKKLPLILESVSKALSQKHLLFFADDPDLQKLVEGSDFAGKIEHSLSDYLYIHSTNLGGMKSSLNVSETVKQEVTISSDGTVNDNINIIRNHTGSGEWPDGTNKNLMRVLLPQNSSLTAFNAGIGNFWPNFDQKQARNPVYTTGEEAGKTEISYWQNTEPGQQSKSSFEYKTNYLVSTSSDNFVYRLFVQKQPGTLGSSYELVINYPQGFEPVNVKNYDFINRTILIKEVLNSDKEYSIKFERRK